MCFTTSACAWKEQRDKSSGTSALKHPTLSASSRQGLNTAPSAAFKAQLQARRRAPGESLQQLYQDICRLVTLAYPFVEASLITHVGKEAFITALSDDQLEVMKGESPNVEVAFSHAIKV